MTTLTEQARQVFASDRYATRLTGIAIAQVSPHRSDCTLALDQCHRNARGVAMGGVLFTLADFCAAIAANTDCLAQGEELQWVSLDSSIHFLAPAAGHSLTARCSPLKAGRTTALYQTMIEDPDKKSTVAVVETTMVRL